MITPCHSDCNEQIHALEKAIQCFRESFHCAISWWDARGTRAAVSGCRVAACLFRWHCTWHLTCFLSLPVMYGFPGASRVRGISSDAWSGSWDGDLEIACACCEIGVQSRCVSSMVKPKVKKKCTNSND